ncbi:hypothetical protein D869_gp156 [Caulobacter phage CcrRogue]|uniref:Uncharacterized protein n=1 Tax=Caulobacter phage CcrRogue TaxID=2927986 RepID=K4JSN2_9CAUD|nr:hypothetical protein D869_gp156 [Caulobacter phage CcrRogue]AFU86758.1 hypothetical protein CcrRogue_gp276 [Caulobacter phage CcrRogue]
MENIFEVASREKYRYESAKGLISTEDLWDLPLTSDTGKANLNDIAVGLFKQVKDLDDISFVTPKTLDKTVAPRLEIVKAVIAYRQDQNRKKLEASTKRETARILQEAIAAKRSEKIAGTPLEELEAQLAALKAEGVEA